MLHRQSLGEFVLMSCSRSDLNQAATSKRWGDFTEAVYRRLIGCARTAGYRFAFYRERPGARHLLWRHDVDFSMHRAVRLAEIEREEGAKATYFVNPHCAFYNLLEPEITALVHRIVELGHEIGLYFDSDGYPEADLVSGDLAPSHFPRANLLSSFLGCRIQRIQLSNPDTSDILAVDDDEIAGLLNAYGRTLRNSYGYASDSNGYWRFPPDRRGDRGGRARTAADPDPSGVVDGRTLAPRARIARCVNGRAEKTLRRYRRVLRRTGRENLVR